MVVNPITEELYDMMGETISSIFLMNPLMAACLINRVTFEQLTHSGQPQSAPVIVTINGAIVEQSMCNVSLMGQIILLRQTLLLYPRMS